MASDDPASVLDYARDRNSDEDRADRDVMIAAAKYASMHTEDSLVGPVESWHESCLPLGGAGCPGVADLAIAEFADRSRGSTPGRVADSSAVSGGGATGCRLLEGLTSKRGATGEASG